MPDYLLIETTDGQSLDQGARVMLYGLPDAATAAAVANTYFPFSAAREFTILDLSAVNVVNVTGAVTTSVTDTASKTIVASYTDQELSDIVAGDENIVVKPTPIDPAPVVVAEG